MHTVFSPPLPWPKYCSAFQVEKTGLFYYNAEGLAKAYDLLVAQRMYQLDGRLFRPPSYTGNASMTIRVFHQVLHLSKKYVFKL